MLRNSCAMLRYSVGVTGDELDRILGVLRRHGGDAPDVEVKHAAGGLPEFVMSTLCAFANRPGGGTLILGVNESENFAVTGVVEPAKMAAALANKARDGFEPPIAVDVDVISDLSVVVARVHETPPSYKPCRRRGSGEAFLRFADGDFRLSEMEISGFIANRDRPRFDQAIVPEATMANLDATLVAELCVTARRNSQALSRIDQDDLLLMKLGAISPDRIPTIAGVLCLSDYPQQFFPNFVIQAGAQSIEGIERGIRFDDSARFDGPIPMMLDGAIEWARRNTRHAVSEQANGHVTTNPDIPAVALREILVNAVVHRDLAPWSWSRTVELRSLPDRFVVSNPGGLWGVTVDRLGIEQITSARNESLIRICQFLRLRDNNVIEAMASGIPKVLAALSKAQLPPAQFSDQGIRFTVIIRRGGRPSRAANRNPAVPTPAETRLLEVIERAGPLSTSDIADQLGISDQAVRRTLTSLRAKGQIETIPGESHRQLKHRRPNQN